MKKIFVFVLMLLLTVTVSAESQFKNAGELFQHWEGNDAYPDYVCGVWSTDGGHINLTISVLDNEEGNRGKEEILDLVENDATIIFEYGEYSYNFLRRVQRELEPYMNLETGFISSGVDVRGSRLNIGILEEKLGTPETVAMLEEIKEKYGDIFSVEASKMVELYTLEEQLPDVILDGNKVSSDHMAFAVIGAMLLLLLAFVVLRRRVAVTDTGDTVTNAPLTKRSVKKMIASSTVEYPSELDEKIKKALQ